MSAAPTIFVKIDVTKIDKTRLFKGKKGTYLDIALVASKNDSYGNDYMVIQSVSKEEREAGKRGPIIGNGKFAQKREDKTEQPQANPDGDAAGDDVPF